MAHGIECYGLPFAASLLGVIAIGHYFVGIVHFKSSPQRDDQRMNHVGWRWLLHVPRQEVGMHPAMTGLIERTVFFSIVAAVPDEKLVDVGLWAVGGWFGVKILHGWPGFRESEPARRGSFVALMCTLLSLFIASVGGVAFRAWVHLSL